MEGHQHDPGLIAAYIEGRLQGEERTRFTDHLAGCAECRGTLALLAREASALGGPALGGDVRGNIAASPAVWLPVAAALIVATVVGLRSGWFSPPEARPSLSTSSPALTSIAPSARPPRPSLVSPVPQATPAPAVSGRIDESLLLKRGGERRVAGKTFRLVAGEWRDAAFDPTAGLPVVEVQPLDRAERLSRIPGLAPYAALGPRVVVVFEGTVYRFRPPSP